MEHDLTRLKLGLEDLKIEVTSNQLTKFNRLTSLLIEWNEKINLTAIVDPQEIMVEHFLDSLAILSLMDIKDDQRIIDVGTGAGFPGIPIKILRPHIKLVLLDSLKKRTEYLRVVSHELGLSDVEIIHSRAEDLGKVGGYREGFDLALSRAVAPLNVLVEFCMPFVRNNGFFVSYKGPAAGEELQVARNAIKLLGGGPDPQIEGVPIPYSPKTHNLILIKKQTPTPKKYPRSPGKIKKSPL